MFITFEGGEGSGKSVQSRLLYRRLQKAGVPALITHEPGGTPLGASISRWLKWQTAQPLSPTSELLLFNASRAQLVESVIRPALEAGRVVVCDRFNDSTLAYQGYGRGLSLQTVEHLGELVAGGLKPDLTFLLDLSPEAGMARKKTQPDRFEQERLKFHQRVRRGYLALAHGEPSRWYILDAGDDRKELAAIIWEKVSRILGCKVA
jgi:dTMP kinase